MLLSCTALSIPYGVQSGFDSSPSRYQIHFGIPLHYITLSSFEEPAHIAAPVIAFQLHFAPLVRNFIAFKHEMTRGTRLIMRLRKYWRRAIQHWIETQKLLSSLLRYRFLIMGAQRLQFHVGFCFPCFYCAIRVQIYLALRMPLGSRELYTICSVIYTNFKTSTTPNAPNDVPSNPSM